MLSYGTDDDDDRKKRSPCPKCQAYLEQVEVVVQNVDDIERRLEELKKFFASREWVLIENAENLKRVHNPEKDIDMDSLQQSWAQATRFNRVVESALRGLMRIQSACDDFGGVDENR
jgi:hypothetical protein